jgi:hypothetical protein
LRHNQQHYDTLVEKAEPLTGAEKTELAELEAWSLEGARLQRALEQAVGTLHEEAGKLKALSPKLLQLRAAAAARREQITLILRVEMADTPQLTIDEELGEL